MELKLVMIVAQFIDLCLFSVNGIPNLQIVESVGYVNGKQHIQKSVWHHFNYSYSDNKWDSVSEFSQNIPYCSTIKASSYGNTVFSVFESNTDNALVVMKTLKDSGNVFRNITTIPVDMDEKSWMNVTIPYGGTWNSSYLNMQRSLFNPHILAINNDKAIVTANPADATARLFEIDNNVKEIMKIDHCIEPSLVNFENEKKIIYRRCPENWPVYRNRSNTGTTPELLPIYSLTLDTNYSIVDTTYISNGYYTGYSFIFDVYVETGNLSKNEKYINVILATVTGLIKKPILHICSSDEEFRPRIIASFPLKEVPCRIRVLKIKKDIFVVCAFKKKDGYHIMTLTR